MKPPLVNISEALALLPEGTRGSAIQQPEVQQAIEAERAEVAAGEGKKGRPRKKVDWNQVAYLANLGCTAQEICAVIGVSEDTMRRGKRGEIFARLLRGGLLKANVSIRRVLFGTLRGRLIDPQSGAVVEVPVGERIAMAKYLANRKVYLGLEAASEGEGGGGPSVVNQQQNVLVINIGADDKDLDGPA